MLGNGGGILVREGWLYLKDVLQLFSLSPPSCLCRPHSQAAATHQRGKDDHQQL